MKKTIAREFLWFVFAAALAFPLGLVFLHFLDSAPVGEQYSNREEIFLTQLYFVGVVLSFIGVYLVRLIVVSLKIVF